ncbi:MAG: 1-acyl-sn-glycerol-3-phosphate acyltransferase [Actinomycetia bacterium]|nr:1-acyl-sn-glycerol-3-phosphate acyltransferase [Actinomycetes bacterium]
MGPFNRLHGYAVAVPGHTTRRSKIGPGFRIAVSVGLPFLKIFTKQDWRGFDQLLQQKGGIVVGTNHTSWFDPLPVAHALWSHDRPPRFLGKESVFRVPIFGWIISNAGQIRVYRESSEAAFALRDAVAAAKSGECVVVYPEGTITRDPDVWPMQGKTGAVRIALESGCPLYPMVQWGAQAVMGPYRKQLRLLPRKTMSVWLGEPIDLERFRGQAWTPELLHEATDLLMHTLAQMEGEIRGDIPPKVLFHHWPIHDQADQGSDQ